MERLIRKPPVGVLLADGINCDRETAHMFEKAGGKPQRVHLNRLLEDKKLLGKFPIWAISGGFSFGDHLGSGVVLAGIMLANLREEWEKHLNDPNRLTLGICNGAQVLTRMGAVPFGNLGQTEAVLYHNQIGHFRSDWVNLKVEQGAPATYLSDMPTPITYMVAHAEGRFTTSAQTLEEIERQRLTIFRYVDRLGVPTMSYPENPNSAQNAIAGICNPRGNVIAMMPHPERFVEDYQHPDRTRVKFEGEPWGLSLARRMIKYAAQT